MNSWESFTILKNSDPCYVHDAIARKHVDGWDDYDSEQSKRVFEDRSYIIQNGKTRVFTAFCPAGDELGDFDY